MRSVNGVPLLLTALMLSAGMIPAAAQEAGDTGQLSVADLVSDAGGGSVEASVDEGTGDDGASDEGASDEGAGDFETFDVGSEGEVTDYSISIDLIEDDLNGPAPEDLVVDEEGPFEDVVIDLGNPFDEGAEPEVLVLPAEGFDPVTVEDVEMNLTATGTGAPLPGTEEVQRTVTVQPGAAAGSEDDSCSVQMLAKRPLTCD